jgi:hypothetical protein
MIQDWFVFSMGFCLVLAFGGGLSITPGFNDRPIDRPLVSHCATAVFAGLACVALRRLSSPITIAVWVVILHSVITVAAGLVDMLITWSLPYVPVFMPAFGFWFSRIGGVFFLADDLHPGEGYARLYIANAIFLLIPTLCLGFVGFAAGLLKALLLTVFPRLWGWYSRRVRSPRR